MTNPASWRKSSTFQTSTISDGHFPLKAEDRRAVHPAVLGEEKRTNPSTKTHDPQEQRQFLISNRKSKPRSEAVQENYRQEQTGECNGLHAFPCKPALLCLKFTQTKNQKIYEQFLKKIADPERRFALPAKTKHARISCSGAQRA